MARRAMMKNIKAVVLIAIILAISLVHAEDGDCVHFVNSTAGYISSPNYPHAYPNSTECIWNLEANPGERIKLTFYDFDLENFNFDYVALYDGRTETDFLLGIFSGNETLPPVILSTTDRMLVVFRTDNAVQHTGFIASYVKEIISIRNFPGVADIGSYLKKTLLGARHQYERSINRWGTNIAKTAVALFLNDKQFFAPGNRSGEEIAYELSLQLLSKLAFKNSISTKDLALYINALTVACFDPKDFFGVNFVKELRKRVNKSNNIHPFSVLTLCNANDTMTMEDVFNLQELYDVNFRPVWTDAQAMVVMALSCIHSRLQSNLTESILIDMVSELKKKQHTNGTIDNWKTTALVLQALIAAGDYQTNFNLSAALIFLLEGTNNNLIISESYYVLPILNDMSLSNVNSDHCATFYQTERRNNLHEHPAERIHVQISLIAEDGMDFYHTWKVKVPSNYSFYQVLETIGTMDHSYKAQYSVSEGKPYIVGFANLTDSTEDGSFWYIYSRPLSSPGNLKLIELSPVDIKVNETDEMILWYRSGFWSNSDEGSGFINDTVLLNRSMS